MNLKDIGNYIVYSNGTVWSKHYKRFIKFKINNSGYKLVSINNKFVSLHRLIASCFIPNPLNLPEIHHLNNNKLDCSVNNLIWCTSKFNIKKSFEDGLNKGPNSNGRITGQKHHLSKLKDTDVYKIKYEHKNLKHAEIAKIYNCTKETVGRIRANISWKHI